MPLSEPITAVAVERSSGGLGRAAVAAMQGVRSSFEDAHFLDQALGVCAVYDGHVGDEAAAFCAERLHLHVRAANGSPRDALPAAFAACDGELRGALPEGSEAGTTATFALVREDGSPDSLKIWVANLGDSRAVLWRKAIGQILSTRDHRPSDPEERKRIEAAGGTVDEDFEPSRIDGQLACSRALGDYKYKQGSLPPGEQKVSSVPEIYEWEAQRGDWLILACDGVWDTISNEKALEEVRKENGDANLGDALARTLALCISKEADDNLTLMAIELGAVPEEPRTVSVLPGNFLKAHADVLEHYASFCLRFGFAIARESRPKQAPIASLTAAEPAPSLFAGLPPPRPAQETAPAAPEAPPPALPASAELPKAVEKPAAPVDKLRPLVVVGPSGVGKGTLIQRLMAAFPGRFGFSVSHTTRGPRPGETDGQHYHFVSDEVMRQEIKANAFVEHASVHGRSYGTSKKAMADVQTAGKICILDIDVQGAQQVKGHKDIDAIFLFIVPPSPEELEKRLRGRGTETEQMVKVRSKNALEELVFGEENPDFFDHVMVNGSLESSTRELLALARQWYPSLTRQMKVTAQRSAAFYVTAARELVAEKTEGPQPAELEVMGLGNAIPSAAAVCAALAADGHKVVLVETGLVEVTPGSGARKAQCPQVRAILRLAKGE